MPICFIVPGKSNRMNGIKNISHKILTYSVLDKLKILISV